MDESVMVQLADFRFRDKFVDITDLQFNDALQTVNAQFSGVYSLWSTLPPDLRRAKRELCINYLLGWQLVVLYPEQAVGVESSGSIPLKGKTLGPINLQFRDMLRQGSGTLDILTTNTFGLQALAMIQSAPENYVLY